MSRTSPALGASLRRRSISPKISLSDAPVTFVVTSALSYQTEDRYLESTVLRGEYV